MPELLRDLQEKRDILNIEAQNNRKERDELNEVARSWIHERDRYNAELREHLDNANNLKQVREDYNQTVKKYKLERERWNSTVTKLTEAVNNHKRRLKGVPLITLERQLKSLEFRQMTSVLSVEDERELTKELSKLQALIKKGEGELLKNEEYRKLLDELSHAKIELEKFVRLVDDSAEKAQRAHEEMRRIFEKCDKARAKGDEAQANFLRVKAQADVFHNRYIENVKEIRELDRVIIGILQKDKMAKEAEDEISAKKEAEGIFERFKKGEKLSTEDLMTLQKSGYI